MKRFTVVVLGCWIITLAGAFSEPVPSLMEPLCAIQAAWAEPQASTKAPPQKAPQQAGKGVDPAQTVLPNIIVIVQDSLRADHLGCYGYSKNTTPYIDQLASEGVLFENYRSNTSWTRASMATFLSSQYPGRTGINSVDAHLVKDIPWLPETLKKHGYYTFGASCNAHLAPYWGFNRGYDEYYLVTRDRVEAVEEPQDEWKKGCDDANVVLFSFLERVKNTPFFAFHFLIDTHTPFLPPDHYQARFGVPPSARLAGASRNLIEFTERYLHNPQQCVQELENVISLYDAELAFFDDQVGEIIYKLKELKIYDNTLVILTSDHGEAFFEHGIRGHGETLHEEETRVPFIIRGPGIPKNIRIKQLATEIDVAPSILAYTKIKFDPRRWQGTSFMNLIEGDLQSRKFWDVFLDLSLQQQDSRMMGVANKRFKFLWTPKGNKYELYNLERDPGEKVNIYNPKSLTSMDFKKKLEGFKQFTYPEKQPIATPKAPTVERSTPPSKEVLDGLKDLGYIN